MTKERLIKQLIFVFILHSCKTDSNFTYNYKTNIASKDEVVTAAENCSCKSNKHLPYKPIEHLHHIPIELLQSTLIDQLHYKPVANLRIKRSASLPLHCPSCEKIHCYKQRKRKLSCKGGWTLGICGCCKVCAKLEGEQCGGQHGYLGKCDLGLYCESKEPKLVSVLRNGAETVYKVESGICRKVSSRVVVPNEICKPKCDPVYCLKNSRGICSAADNAERVQVCQGHCQHTSCRACKFVPLDQQCSSCSKNDFKCIREFGRCTRKQSCKPKDYPCGNPVMSQRNEGIFQCQVPECAVSN